MELDIDKLRAIVAAHLANPGKFSADVEYQRAVTPAAVAALLCLIPSRDPVKVREEFKEWYATTAFAETGNPRNEMTMWMAWCAARRVDPKADLDGQAGAEN